MGKTAHVLGNGDQCVLYKKEKREGLKLLCNLPPFAVDPSEVYATCMVDFKMMAALTQGSLNLDMYPWILGTRPQIWMNDPRQSVFYLKYAQNVKEFYTTVPEYAGNATNFNCGHMAVHYAAKKQKADEINMYGFDTLFDFNMNSVSDLYLSSDRGQTNNYRLINNWRPVWFHLFQEFPKTKFVLHHTHSDLKIPNLDNVEIITYDSPKTKKPEKDENGWTVKTAEVGINRKHRRALAKQEKEKQKRGQK